MLFGLAAVSLSHVVVVLLLGLFAVGAASHGAITLWRAMRGGAGRRARAVAGAVDLVTAIGVILRAHLGARSLVWLIGLWAVARSLILIVEGLSFARPDERRWPRVAGGAVGLGFGLMLASQRVTGGPALTRLIGAWAFFLGVAAVGVALELRAEARAAAALSRRDDTSHGDAANAPRPPDL
jgi:uncharacterized membrane protein HdeD (DUF308 family)